MTNHTAAGIRRAHHTIDASSLSSTEKQHLLRFIPEYPILSLTDVRGLLKEAYNMRDREPMLDRISNLIDEVDYMISAEATTVEVEVPDHPDKLATEDDYQDAPDGTIITSDSDGVVLVKMDGDWLIPGMTSRLEGWALAPTPPRRVLRWGAGE